MEEQDRTVVPEPVTLSGTKGSHVRPTGEELEKSTVPAKLFRAVSKIVEIAGCPAATGLGEEAVIVKSTTFTVITAVV